MSCLIIIRHGQSVWNQENRFTGWEDIKLSENGKKEAKLAAVALADFNLDIAFTSYLCRAADTLRIVLEEKGLTEIIPVYSDWRLNERHYGALQGYNKSEAAEKYGAEQVHSWRRGYEDVPPESEDISEIKADKRYDGVPIPRSESLKTVRKRVVACFDERIAPLLQADKTVLIAAHGNSLRSLCMHLEDMSAEEIINRNIPTGTPIIYTLDKNLRSIGRQKLIVN